MEVTAFCTVSLPESQSYAAKMLEDCGVQTRLGTTVKEVGFGHVILSDGTRIDSHVVIWAGGLKASSLSDHLGVQTGKGGRIDVQPDLTVPGFSRVYALGDFANIAGNDGKPLPQLASVAEQSGKWCAKNILADIAGAPRKPFGYFDQGIMAMIGRNSAVAEMGEHRHELKGTLAFAAWLGVHASLLSSTQAKVEAFVEWAWEYFRATRGDAILDWVDEDQIDWNDNGESVFDINHASSRAQECLTTGLDVGAYRVRIFPYVARFCPGNRIISRSRRHIRLQLTMHLLKQ
jgi:NADH:ubiquinone reductase (H+-translocating)